MILRSHFRNRRAGFTLVEMCVGLGIASLLTASIVALGMYSTRTFNMVGNYVDLDAQSRHAADILGREIRDSSALLAFGTNTPVYLELTNDTARVLITIKYNKYTGTLVMTKTGQPAQTLLTDCNTWSFSLFDRHPNITATNITFYAATNGAGQLDPSFCKVIDLSWECSRTIFGAKFNTESVQTAQIVLRNKIE